MIFTIRLNNDRNVEFVLKPDERTLYIIDPIPGITKEQLIKLSDDFHYSIGLPIIETMINPDNEITIEELEQDYTSDSETAIKCILAFANMMITGD